MSHSLSSETSILQALINHSVSNANLWGLKSVVAVHEIYVDCENTWTIDEIKNQSRISWLKQIHEDNPSSRIITFSYDATRTGAGIYTIGRIRDKALQLLDDLVDVRRGPDVIFVFFPLILDLSVGVGQRADIFCCSIQVVH